MRFRPSRTFRHTGFSYTHLSPYRSSTGSPRLAARSRTCNASTVLASLMRRLLRRLSTVTGVQAQEPEQVPVLVSVLACDASSPSASPSASPSLASPADHPRSRGEHAGTASAMTGEAFTADVQPGAARAHARASTGSDAAVRANWQTNALVKGLG